MIEDEEPELGEWATVAEIASVLNISTTVVRKIINKNGLESKGKRYRTSDVDTHLPRKK